MEIKYFDNEIPRNYSDPVINLGDRPIQDFQGKTYYLLGRSEETLISKTALLICTLFKTVFSLGLALFSENVRNDWATIISGKKPVILYASSFLKNKIEAQKGNVQAQYDLGMKYAKGSWEGLNNLANQTPFHEAIKYLKLAADQDHVKAQFQLGKLYLHQFMWPVRGINDEHRTPENFEKAKHYLQKAAVKGHHEAGIALGEMQMYQKNIIV